MKKEQEFENDKFLTVFNCSNRDGREKEKSNYRFPSVVKNNAKVGLKLSKVRREK